MTDYPQSTNESTYEEIVDVERLASALAGKGTEQTTLTELRGADSPALLRAFADDIDIQQMTIISTNYGFVRQYTKRFKKRRHQSALHHS